MKVTIYGYSNSQYAVRVYDRKEVIHEYIGGNACADSTTVLPVGTVGTIRPEQMAEMALKTATEIAEEYETAAPEFDEDIVAELKESENVKLESPSPSAAKRESAYRDADWAISQVCYKALLVTEQEKEERQILIRTLSDVIEPLSVAIGNCDSIHSVIQFQDKLADIAKQLQNAKNSAQSE